MRLLFILGVSCISLAGCSHVPPMARAGCAFVAYPLRVDDGRGTAFEDVLARAMTQPPSAARERPSVLILSGGSQHGAFGAGFFAGMKAIPDYKMVTAVSTGALQSTFLFLANQPVPDDRRYPAYMQIDRPASRTNAGDLALAYSIRKESDLVDVGAHGQLGGVIRGSVANFTPLRRTLAGLLSQRTLEQVGSAYDADPQRGRRLLLGVTDVNDGNGYAIDLTELASRVARGSQDFATVQGCYIDALVASSSVPVAAPPVTLERRLSPQSNEVGQAMYVDGGARFGVFWKQLDIFAQSPVTPDVTLIVNGKLFGSPWIDGNGQAQTKWSSITLGLRTVDILENQVYRFSVENILRLGTAGAPVKMAFISSNGLGPEWKAWNQFPYDGRTCGEWLDDDRRKLHPTEFYPHYMRCLIAYGRARGEAGAWNSPVAPDALPDPGKAVAPSGSQKP